MKSSTAWGIGLGTAAVVGFGALVLRKPRTTNGRRGGGQQGSGDGSSPGPIPKGESRSINWKGCLGTLTHLAATDEMGNNYFWSVHRGEPGGQLVASGAEKLPRTAEQKMWEALRWQICQPPATHRTTPGGG